MKAAYLLTIVLATQVSAEEIPLKKIWATNMPSTRNIRELEPRTEGDHRKYGPLMHTIDNRLRGGRRGVSGEAGPGFAVPDTGIAALHAAYDVLVDEQTPQEVLPAGEVSLIFYARRSGLYCYLEHVGREENVVTLKYRFHVHRTGDVTNHFALIPLGKLSPGKYEVRMVQLKVANPPTAGKVTYRPQLDGDRVKNVVSQPFSFEVK